MDRILIKPAGVKLSETFDTISEIAKETNGEIGYTLLRSNGKAKVDKGYSNAVIKYLYDDLNDKFTNITTDDVLILKFSSFKYDRFTINGSPIILNEKKIECVDEDDVTEPILIIADEITTLPDNIVNSYEPSDYRLLHHYISNNIDNFNDRIKDNLLGVIYNFREKFFKENDSVLVEPVKGSYVTYGRWKMENKVLVNCTDKSSFCKINFGYVGNKGIMKLNDTKAFFTGGSNEKLVSNTTNLTHDDNKKDVMKDYKRPVHFDMDIISKTIDEKNTPVSDNIRSIGASKKTLGVDLLYCRLKVRIPKDVLLPEYKESYTYFVNSVAVSPNSTIIVIKCEEDNTFSDRCSDEFVNSYFHIYQPDTTGNESSIINSINEFVNVYGTKLSKNRKKHLTKMCDKATFKKISSIKMPNGRLAKVSVVKNYIENYA